MKITMRKGVVLIMILGLFWSPIIVSASWWNPLSWKVFSGVFNRASVGQDLKLNKNSTPTLTTATTTTTKNISGTSVVEQSKKQPEQAISKTKPTNNDLALNKKDNLQKIPITNVATTSKEKDNVISLLQEQNDTLKKQLETQQQIIQSTARINGSCSTVLNVCKTGDFIDVDDTNTLRLWSCRGINGGVTVSCHLYNPVPNPTNVSTCSPNWQTESWGACTNSQQTRIVKDSNNCGVTTNKPKETQACTVSFIAEISLDKNTLGNNGVDSIKANVKIKDSNGNVVPNKDVQIITENGPTIIKTNSIGEINTTISTTGPAGSRAFKVSVDGSTYEDGYTVVETNISIPINVWFQEEGNMSRIVAPGKDQQLAILSHWESPSLPARYIYLKKVTLKITGLDSTWISNIRIQAYPPPCSQYFCYQGNITSPLDANATQSSDGTIEITLTSPLRVVRDTYVYVYADITNPTTSNTDITYSNQFISAEVTGMVNGYTPSNITVYSDGPSVVSSRLDVR